MEEMIVFKINDDVDENNIWKYEIGFNRLGIFPFEKFNLSSYIALKSFQIVGLETLNDRCSNVIGIREKQKEGSEGEALWVPPRIQLHMYLTSKLVLHIK